MAVATDTTGIRWDGRTCPYIPPDELTIHESVRLHDEADEQVDLVTHEVLRHALWNVNTEHGNTIMKISGSPICAYGHDFNPAILEGDIFLCNDPWIGATHQSDVAVMAPVFWEGKLFCWVANTLHQWDLGG